jgi:hypothetical protein
LARGWPHLMLLLNSPIPIAIKFQRRRNRLNPKNRRGMTLLLILSKKPKDKQLVTAICSLSLSRR